MRSERRVIAGQLCASSRRRAEGVFAGVADGGQSNRSLRRERSLLPLRGLLLTCGGGKEQRSPPHVSSPIASPRPPLPSPHPRPLSFPHTPVLLSWQTVGNRPFFSHPPSATLPLGVIHFHTCHNLSTPPPLAPPVRRQLERGLARVRRYRRGGGQVGNTCSSRQEAGPDSSSGGGHRFLQSTAVGAAVRYSSPSTQTQHCS